MQRNASYILENVTFRSRETELAWTMAFPADAVFTAVEQAARQRGLRPAMASREHGLIIAKPPLSPLTMGRKVIFGLSALSPARTRVKAQYVHGAVVFQSRESRLELLDTVLRAALLSLENELDIRAKRTPGSRPTTTPVQVQPAPARPAPASAEAEAAPPRPEHRETPPPEPEPEPRAVPKPAAGSLKHLDFGRVDWSDIPLEPPPPEDFERYRRAAGSGRLSMGAKLLWLAVGVGIFFGLAMLAGMLGMVTP